MAEEKSVEELIKEETEKRIHAMEQPGYAFPQRVTKIDWIVMVGLMVISSVLIGMCMVGVIQ